jgi:hypothetical protein
MRGLQMEKIDHMTEYKNRGNKFDASDFGSLNSRCMPPEESMVWIWLQNLVRTQEALS